MVLFAYVLLFMFSLHETVAHAKPRRAKPNIVLILADDQDQVLGGMDRMPRTNHLLGTLGANLTNYFVSTPVCCPSRAELVGGRYGHNNVAVVPNVSSCGHANITGPYFVQHQLGKYLADLGYTTGLFGKYMNVPPCSCPKASGCGGGVQPDMDYPPGWSRWFALCNPQESHGGGYFWNIFNDQGSLLTTGYDPSSYMTAVIGNRTLEWIRNVSLFDDKPFFAYVAPHAPHVSDGVYPYITTPAPWYAGTIPTNVTSPRTPNWNVPNRNAHSLIRNQPLLDPLNIEWSDSLYRARQESMMSVDDLVHELIEVLNETGELNNTYVFFTSDHGYQLGQMSLPSGKFNVYENDIRVPMLVRGPTIPPGTLIPQVTGIVDIAPTFIELAGGNPSELDFLDGTSLVPLLLRGNSQFSWDRDMYLIEYWSQGVILRGAVVSPSCNPAEGHDCALSNCTCHNHMVDGVNNTFLAARLVNETHNFLLAQFYADRLPNGFLPQHFSNLSPVYVEVYNMTADPWQMNNLHPKIESENPTLLAEMRSFMYRMNSCKGVTCRKNELRH